MTDAQLKAVLEYNRTLLESVRADFNLAAQRRAQYIYMQGTIIGLAVLLPVLALIGVLARLLGYSALDDEPLAIAFGCAIAGALGACASVSWRVTLFRGFKVDPGASVLTLRSLGMLRPWIGAVFGLALYFALRSGFISIGEENANFYFFAFFSFVAGFSEQMVPDLVRSTERRVGEGQQT